MGLNKQVLRETLAQYRAWNEAKFAAQVLQRGQQTPEEKWRAYEDLDAFGRQIKPKPSQWARLEKAKEWETYYARIRQFEKWRQERARKSSKGASPSRRIPGEA